jgi:hypothetical protein
VTALRADGSAAIYAPEDAPGDGGAPALGVVHEWTEPRFRAGASFVGLACADGCASPLLSFPTTP